MGTASPAFRRTDPDRQVTSSRSTRRNPEKRRPGNAASDSARSMRPTLEKGRSNKTGSNRARSSRKKEAPQRSEQSAGRWSRVYAIVDRIPRGRVATYGQIARLAGPGTGARQVGYALHALPEGSSTPWHRVINRLGEISLRAGGGHDALQRILLERECVRFDQRGRIDLSVFGWKGPR